MSSLAPLLQANRVRLVGIGFEADGWEEFIEGDFFTGELFLDTERESFAALEMKEWSLCSLMCSLLNPKTLGLFLAKDGIAGNNQGNSFQSGGCMIVGTGGKQVLLIFRESNPSFHVPLEEVLRALRIDPKSGFKE